MLRPRGNATRTRIATHSLSGEEMQGRREAAEIPAGMQSMGGIEVTSSIDQTA